MDDIDPDKLLAALQQLEAEKQRRLQAKLDAGEAALIQVAIIDDEPVERAKARVLAGRSDAEGREIIFEFIHINTGVPRHDDFYAVKPDVSESVSSGPPPLGPAEAASLSHGARVPPPEPEEAASESIASQPIYVWTSVRHGDLDGDPGEIAEGWFSVEGGAVVLTDRDGRLITSRALLGEDPATLARQLLREIRKPANFNRRPRYPPLSVA